MQSANTLLNRTSSKTVQNIPITERNPLYNPSTPVINDQNFKPNMKDLRAVRLQDRYYTDMVLNSVTKNGDGYTLGANNNGFTYFNNYDRAIDPNLIARRKVNNKQYTQPNDFYNGSIGAYYSLPKTVARPQPITPDIGSLTNSMNAYQYRNTSMSGGLPVPIGSTVPVVTTPADSTIPPPLSLPTPIDPIRRNAQFDTFRYGGAVKPLGNFENNTRMMNDVNTISFDPTTDPAYLKYQDELNKSRLAAAGAEGARRNQTKIYDKYGIDTRTDENGMPIIKAPMRIGIRDIG